MWVLFSATAFALPAMWLAHKGDTRIWLFGSVHLLPPGIEWRSEILESALQNADTVYFEAIVDLEDPGADAREAMGKYLVPSGSRLLDLLTPEERELVAWAAKEVGAPLSGLNIFRPWVAAEVLATFLAARQGFDFAAGVDVTLQGEVSRNKLRAFETLADQFAFFDEIPADQQIAYLLSTAKGIQTTPDALKAIVANWAAGKPEEIAENVADDLGTGGSTDDILLHRRNARWLEELKTLLGEPGDTLVVVGAAHLAGDGSLVDLLEAEGLTIERVQ
ncbi:hypothetical protein XM25_07660 [Devosia sp. H5989]|nr:hypothetical protein XM25_07660 [Devosia sp. H5989]